MYNGEYDKASVTLKEEMDRKRFDKENCEAILYKAGYVYDASWNPQKYETRVVKLVCDNGNVCHGILDNVVATEKTVNNLDGCNSIEDLMKDFWCPEIKVPDDNEEYPFKIYIDEKCVNDKALKEWAESPEPDMFLTEAIAEKLFEKYCHGNGKMAILEIDGEKYAYDGTFGDGQGTEHDAGRGDAEALAVKIGSYIDENYLVHQYGVMAPERELTDEQKKYYEVNSPEWVDLYDDEKLYVRYNCAKEHLVLEDYLDKEFIDNHAKIEKNFNMEKDFNKFFKKLATESREKVFFNEFKNLCEKYNVSTKKAAQFISRNIQQQSSPNLSR